MNLKCDKCEKNFSKKSNLHRHLKNVHRVVNVPIVKRGRPTRKASDDGPSRKTMCSVCNASFSCRQNLYRHRRSKHQQNQPTRSPAATGSGIEKFDFSTVSEFLEWKSQVEKATTSTFVKCRKDREFGGVTSRTYICHRSGIFRQRGHHIRHLKVQGSCKIGSRCPAAIYSHIWKSGRVAVTFHPDHTGHHSDVAHQQLTRSQRSEIAGLLAIGVQFEDIIDRIQLSGDNASVSRIHFTSKQDLQNIVRDFNLSRGIVYSRNDADSVASWIAHNKLDGDKSMVRYAKFQGEPDDVRGLASDDFVLIIMTESQVATLRQLYQPLKEVAMDSTHGTNSYDYQLTTIMLIDEHGEGFPACFCFSNHVNELTMKVFLSVCKECTGQEMEKAVLMTDDTEVYYNAWCEVMGVPAHRLLCTWHVDRAWRKNLPKVKGDAVLKATVYKTIRALMDVTDTEVFQLKLKQFMDIALADTKVQQFAVYFGKEYAKRPQLWALCYRLGLHVHHNMHLEALHRVLKHVHMKGRKVKRMDKCIHALLRLIRCKMNDRLLKINKGKWTRHLLGIRSRHKRGVQCKATKVAVIEPNRTFTVQGSKENEVYVVGQNDEVPHDDPLCPLRCEICGICVHTFSCNCVDAGLHTTICKHVHLVVTSCKPVISSKVQSDHIQKNKTCDVLASNQVSVAHDQDPDPVSEMQSDTVEHEETVLACRRVELDETEEILHHFQSCKRQGNAQRSIAMAEEHWSVIRAKMNEDAEISAGVCDQLARIRSWITAVESKKQLDEQREPLQPANKRMSPQRRYFASTKKKAVKRKREERLMKPNDQEKSFLLDTLGGDVPNVSSTMRSSDHDYDCQPGDVVSFEHSY